MQILENEKHALCAAIFFFRNSPFEAFINQSFMYIKIRNILLVALRARTVYTKENGKTGLGSLH